MRGVTGNVPSACAISVGAEPSRIAFVAGRHSTTAVGNLRKIRAYWYPKQYAKQAPTFARACLARIPGQKWLLLLGTASIVGRHTVHAGDVRLQVREKLTNINAVIDEANRAGRSERGFHPHDFQFRIYVRYPEDLTAVRKALGGRQPPGQEILFLHADICHSDLDVEIEGAAGRPLARVPA